MSTHLVVSLLVAALPLAPFALQDRNASAVPKKGDTITVKGCLRGGAVESTGVDWGETSVGLADGLTFRLTGDKKLVSDLKKKHDAHLVSVTGVLKTDMATRGPDTTTKIGNMRIGIGAPAANPASVEAGNRRVLPVLEVKSFDGMPTSCGR
jgi:hypothetical protein